VSNINGVRLLKRAPAGRLAAQDMAMTIDINSTTGETDVVGGLDQKITKGMGD
jgi:hypothetical protein